MWQFIVWTCLSLFFLGLSWTCGHRAKDAWYEWRKPHSVSRADSGAGSTGFKISGNGNVLKGNMAIGYKTGFDVNGDRNVLEDNLSVGIVKDGQNISQIENILNQNLFKLEQSTNKESNFDMANLYDVAARKYAIYGLWEQSINNAYKALSLYIKVSQNDPSEIYQRVFCNYPSQFKKDSIDGMVMHLNFIANTVRKEKNKDFVYFLKQLLVIAEINNNAGAEHLLKQLIKERVK